MGGIQALSGLWHHLPNSPQVCGAAVFILGWSSSGLFQAAGSSRPGCTSLGAPSALSLIHIIGRIHSCISMTEVPLLSQAVSQQLPSAPRGCLDFLPCGPPPHLPSQQPRASPTLLLTGTLGLLCQEETWLLLRAHLVRSCPLSIISLFKVK